MLRAKKAQQIEALTDIFASAAAIVITHYKGLSVAEISELRARLRREGATLKVVKNRLAQKALNGQGGAAGAMFSGPVAIAYGADPVTPAKIATAFAKENDKLKVVGALMGADVLDAAAVDALAKLPSLDQLRARMVGLISAPATRIAGVLQAPGGQIARVLSAYAAKDAA